MNRKLMLLEELVFDPVQESGGAVSKYRFAGSTDSVRHSAGAGSAATDAREAARKMAAHREGAGHRRAQAVRKDGAATPQEQRSPAVTFLLAERESHPEVRRVCDDLLSLMPPLVVQLSRRAGFRRAGRAHGAVLPRLVDVVLRGRESRARARRPARLANASVRSVVRQLLGRGLLHADPAFRPMNETFRHFILTRECSKQVEALESEDGPSAWDRLRAPLGVAVLGVGSSFCSRRRKSCTTPSSASSQPRPRRCRRSSRPSESSLGARWMARRSRRRTLFRSA